MRTVVAAIIQRDGKILVAQRPPTKHYPLQWEFPGGKVEAGETPEAALKREIHEELGVDVAVGAIVDRFRYDYGAGHDYELMFFECTVIAGEPSAQPGQGIHALAWVERSRLPKVAFLEGNRSVARRLAGAGRA